MKTIFRTSFVAALAFCAMANAQTSRPSVDAKTPLLKAGDMAPAAKVEKWLKGSPIESFSDGKIHVVEFWATWCLPCRAGMPHLSNLAKKYGDKVSITGISVWENDGKHTVGRTTTAMDAVEAFVSNAHDMMAYNVAADGDSAYMARSWLSAARVNGIPAAFVVDGSGKIVWIGNPAFGLEQVLELAVEGKFDQAAADRLSAEQTSLKEIAGKLGREINDAIKASNFAVVPAMCDKLMEGQPFRTSYCVSRKYQALANVDPAAAAAFGQTILKDHANAPLLLAEAARMITDETTVMPKRDYPLALAFIQQARQSTALDFNVGSVMAELQFKTGDRNAAIATQKEVLKYLDTNGGTERVREKSAAKLKEYEQSLTMAN